MSSDWIASQTREQMLVDLMFEFVIRVGVKGSRDRCGRKIQRFKTNDEAAAWVAQVLRAYGVTTKPKGMSWGQLE